MSLQKQAELEKQYLNNKNLILYVNYLLLGFYVSLEYIDIMDLTVRN